MNVSIITFYHVSNPKFRDKILEEGLVPQIGDSYRLHYGEFTKEEDLKPAIFVCSRADYCSTYDDDRWEINIPVSELKNMNYTTDKEVHMGFMFFEPIPLKYITALHMGSGDDIF